MNVINLSPGFLHAISLIIMFQSTNFFLNSWSCSWWWIGLPENTSTRVILTLLTATLAISWYAWLIKKSGRPLPPGPPGLPLLGNLPFIESNFYLYRAKLSQTYGPIVKFQMGRKVCIVIGSASLAKEVLKDKGSIFAQHDLSVVTSIITNSGKDIGFSPLNDEWRMMRKIFIQEMMSSKAFEATHRLRRQEVLLMMKEVYGKLGSPINIHDLISLTMVNLVMSQLWGAVHGEERISLGSQIKNVTEEIIGLMVKRNVSDFFPLLARFDLQGIESKAKNCKMRLDMILDTIMENRMKVGVACGQNNDNKGNGSKDFLQILLEIKQEGADDKPLLSVQQIKGIFVDIFIGSFDTTATIVERTMKELLNNPEIMRKACQELEQVVGNAKMVEEFHLPKLPYLAAILKETFRVHPPDPFLLPHTPIETCIVSEYTIPKDSRIYFNVWAIQRDSNAWENPLEFRPERFLRDPAKGDYQGNNFNYFPFGSGRRVCAGIALAEKMLLYMIGSLLHSFEWTLPEGSKLDWDEKIGLALSRTNPLVVVPATKPSTLDHINSIDE